jgi:hypothetical protein
MSRLVRHNRTVTTFFDLLGTSENDMTDALAFTLSRSPLFLRRVVSDLGCSDDFDDDHVLLSVQTRRACEGITDLEIQVGALFFAVLEAKRGASLPAAEQLGRYATVVARHPALTTRLVSVSNSSPESANACLESLSIPGVDHLHRSWRQLRDLARDSRPHETIAAKRVLDQFIAYMEVVLGMDTIYSNYVYVVSLGAGNPEGWSLSLIDIVENRSRYFYPVGRSWPDPPNYLGFRYRGKLQRIHHVDDYVVFTRPHTLFPEAPEDQEWEPHYCFSLGPAILPPHDVLAGPRVMRSNRVRCMIDTLLTSRTISDALTETERRTAKA